MLDLSIFKNRLFAAATAAAFINGLSRFALLFVFVFYFQGVMGDDPITAGIKLTPMAIGMLVSSPLAGIWADRHGSRMLAALGMLVSAAALAGMTTLGQDSPYWQSTLWLGLVGIGSGMFNSPNTAAMMGTVPAKRRGVAAGVRTMLQNTGAVISIAFVLAIVTAAGPKDVLFKIFSGLASGLSSSQLAPFIHNMHTALWVLAITSLIGAGVSLLRPRHVEPCGSRASSAGLATGWRHERRARYRIGDLAKLTETTPRTIRYYEEIGLLASERAARAGRPSHLRRGGPREAPRAAPPAGAARRLARGAARAGGRRERACLAAARVARGDRGSGQAARGAGAGSRPHRLPARPAAKPPRRDREALRASSRPGAGGFATGCDLKRAVSSAG